MQAMLEGADVKGLSIEEEGFYVVAFKAAARPAKAKLPCFLIQKIEAAAFCAHPKPAVAVLVDTQNGIDLKAGAVLFIPLPGPKAFFFRDQLV